MTETWHPIPVKVRTARVTHTCDDCHKPIEPGDKYEHCVTPPHRSDAMDVDWWLTWRSHYPRRAGNVFYMGCDEAAAYRENERRKELANA